jgi:large subunit ribosomal protein L18
MRKMKTPLKIKKRRYSNIYGTAKKPRLSVFRSRKHIYAQLINDEESHTLTSFNSLNLKNDDSLKKQSKLFISYKVGINIAKNGKNNKISKVVFDRNDYLYHGRIKKLAEGAREEGLIF